MERLAYLLKRRCPAVFRFVGIGARAVVTIRYGQRIKAARREALITGTVSDKDAQVRELKVADSSRLQNFLNDLSDEYLEYFRPHAFDSSGIGSVLSSRAILTYGVFVGVEMRAYALLKIAPTGSAFIGLVAHPEMSGRGLGRFIVEYLYWQASLAGFRTRSTISKKNNSSIKSHQAVSDFRVVAELPNDYIMIEFPNMQRSRPELQLP